MIGNVVETAREDEVVCEFIKRSIEVSFCVVLLGV